MRGGRKMEERGARTGEDGSGKLPTVTLSFKARTEFALGSPWKPQHEQMPLQSSGFKGTGCWTSGCEGEETVTRGPSHRSQCGE